MALTLGDIQAEVGGHYSKQRIIWPWQHGAGQRRCHHHDCVTSGQYVLFQHSNILNLAFLHLQSYIAL